MLDKPYKGTGNYIFISYSHKNLVEVMRFIETLQESGYNVWYDEGIDPGTEWDENIATHIENCSFFIAFITNEYVSSQNCRDEMSFARDLDKERLLVYAEDVELPKGMQMRLNRLQAIYKHKYQDENEFYTKVFEANDIEKCKYKLDSKPIAVESISSEKKDNDNKENKTSNGKYIAIIVGIIVCAAIIISVLAFTRSGEGASETPTDISSDTASESVSSSQTDTNKGGNSGDERLDSESDKIYNMPSSDKSDSNHPYKMADDDIPEHWYFVPLIKQSSKNPELILTDEADTTDEPDYACLFFDGSSARYDFSVEDIKTTEIQVQNKDKELQTALVNTEVKFKVQSEYEYAREAGIVEKTKFYMFIDKERVVNLAVQSFDGDDFFILYTQGN